MGKKREMNCWEFKDCPEEKCNTCPTYIKGKGKQCWLVKETMCKEIKQREIHEKILTCYQCEFFKMRGGIPE